jgi:hypothetical protein
MKHIGRAVRRIEELIKMRKEAGCCCQSAGYDVIEAGFLYQQGSILVGYIEAKSDVFGNIPALEIIDSEDEEEEGESQADAEVEKGEEAQKEANKDGQEKAEGALGDEEPRIEDEVEEAARKKVEQQEEEKGQIEGATEGGEKE